MSKFDNNNRGVLFKNPKDGVESRADYRGNAEVNGLEYFLDAWVNTSRDGSTKFLAIRFKPKRALGEKPPSPGAPDFDDEIPF